MSVLALDTSAALPLLLESHALHAATTAWLGRRAAALTAHSLAETYSVLTRLPGDARLAPLDAARLLDATFDAPLTLGRATSAGLPGVLARAGITGGAVYDALVALAAIEHDVELATRDARARRTYDLLGTRAVIVA